MTPRENSVDKFTSGIIYSILGLVFALFIISALFFLPLTMELGIWLPATRHLSFGLLALCVAILAIYLVRTRHPHYDIWLISGGGIILSVFGITDGPKGIMATILTVVAVVALAAALLALPELYGRLSKKWQEVINRRGWTWTRGASKGFSWIWTIAISVIALSLIGLSFYCLYIVLATLMDKEYFISVLFLILGTVTGGSGIWLLKRSIHKFKSAV